MTKIATLKMIDGKLVETNVEEVDFSKVKSNDPIAFTFGIRDGKNNKVILASEINDLASEYIRGYESVQPLNIEDDITELNKDRDDIKEL